MNNKEKKKPEWIIFIVEGLSDQSILEVPIGNMINEKHPEEYHVRFALPMQDLTAENVDYGDDEIDDSNYIYVDEPTFGGDITSMMGVHPRNIEQCIYERCIKPLIKKEGIYPKKIKKVIQIVDIDGVFLPPERIIKSIATRANEKPYYNAKDAVIETNRVESIIKRNIMKCENLCYLATRESITLNHKSIPYEIYFFSSNMDHFINNEPNVPGDNKRALANKFVREYGLSTDVYTHFFFNDSNSIGHLGYRESWDEIQKQNNSIQRFTNIDCLLMRLLSGDI